MNSRIAPLYLSLGAVLVVVLVLFGLSLQALWPNWRWENTSLHGTVESIGGVAAIGMAMVLLLRKQEAGCGNFPLLAMGFLSMGLLEILHGASPPGNGFILLRSLASLFGSIGFALLCLPEANRNGSGGHWLPWLMPAASLVIGAGIFIFPEHVPEMARHGQFTSGVVGVHLVAFGLFFAAGMRFFLDFQRSGRPEFYLFATLAALFSLVESMFKYSALWDARWWWWHLLRLAAYLLVLGYVVNGYIRAVTELRAVLAQSQVTEEALRQSEQDLRQALEDREQIARDLHDGIIQSLYALGLGLKRCQNLIKKDSMEAIRQLGLAITDLNGVIREVRNYIVGLEPDKVTGQSLETALVSLVRTMQGEETVRFRLEVDPAVANHVTPQQARHIVYIVHEAMSNIVRHAKAQTGVILLRLQAGYLHLEVQDDGTGFDPRLREERGRGLRNIAARAGKLGATLEIQSEPLQGSRIRLDLPTDGTPSPDLRPA